MMVRWAAALISVLLCMVASTARSDWEPTFVDNFDGGTLSNNRWVSGREMLPRRLNFYGADAIEVRDGVLRLRALDQPSSDRPYTTAAISTQGLFSQRYGYFEMRARTPSGNGFWPAFWLMPVSGVWTSEIDIAEFRGQIDDGVHYAFHYGRRLRNENGLTADLNVSTSSEFNTYAVRWRPERIDYLFNGEVMHSVVGEALVANADSEMFLILNMALSSQHTSWIPVVDATTNLSDAFEIDYVRVYRETDDGRFADIPSADTPLANTSTPRLDHTAASIERADNDPDIRRNNAPIQGSLDVLSHRDNLSTVVSVVLTELSNFNASDGRYEKSASLETRNFRVNLANAGDRSRIDYAFQLDPIGPAVYSVDVLVRDPASGNKKSLANYRTVQVLSPDAPDSTIYLQGFFRSVTAEATNNGVAVSAQLQLQQALLAPGIELTFEISDIDTGEVLAGISRTEAHDEVGQIPSTALIELELDTSRSLALTARATDPQGTFQVTSSTVHVSGTREPPEGWQGGPATNPPPIGGQPPTGGTIPERNWRVTFVDNFDGDTLNPSAWISGREHVARRINQYARDGVAVSDGRLQLRVLQRAESDRPYTTGAVTTQGLFRQQYGYFEMRARTPAGNGFWPAFWLMPESGRWTSEIDIAEFRGHLPTTVHHAFHYGQRLRNENGRTVELGADTSAGFNNYAVYWTPNRIDYLFNGGIVHSVTDPSAVGNANSQMYLILNLALASVQAQNWIPTVDASSDLGRAFEVDYVRVFQADDNGPLTGIPAADAPLADQMPAAYDATALSVERERLAGEQDLLRDGQDVTGRLRVTSHIDDYDGVVSVLLVPIVEFDAASGRFVKGDAIGSRNFSVRLNAAGEQTTLDYRFEPGAERPQAYVLDVLVRDNLTGNRRSFAGHRTIQTLDPADPSAAALLDGFFRAGGANLVDGQVEAALPLQLQQAMLTPYLTVRYALSSNDALIAEREEPITHDEVGLLRLTPTFENGVDAAQPHTLVAEVRDASGGPVFARTELAVGGTGGNPIAPLPTGSGNDTPPPPDPDPPEPPMPPEPPQAEPVNRLLSASLLPSGPRLDVVLNLQTDGAAPDDTLIYNIKVLANDGSVLRKMTGASNDAAATGVLRASTILGAPIPPGSYRIVVFVFRNSWAQEDLLIFQSTQASLGM